MAVLMTPLRDVNEFTRQRVPEDWSRKSDGLGAVSGFVGLHFIGWWVNLEKPSLGGLKLRISFGSFAARINPCPFKARA
jgi:hypothetical protein